jgi:hypothetical protein
MTRHVVSMASMATPPTARPDGSRKDVDREFATLFMLIDENQSNYLQQNTSLAKILFC